MAEAEPSERETKRSRPTTGGKAPRAATGGKTVGGKAPRKAPAKAARPAPVAASPLAAERKSKRNAASTSASSKNTVPVASRAAMQEATHLQNNVHGPIVSTAGVRIPVVGMIQELVQRPEFNLDPTRVRVEEKAIRQLRNRIDDDLAKVMRNCLVVLDTHAPRSRIRGSRLKGTSKDNEKRRTELLPVASDTEETKAQKKLEFKKLELKEKAVGLTIKRDGNRMLMVRHVLAGILFFKTFGRPATLSDWVRDPTPARPAKKRTNTKKKGGGTGGAGGTATATKKASKKAAA